MTVKEALSAARSLVRKKMRQAAAADKKAYRKAFAIKGVRSGNTRKRSKRSESAAETVDGSIEATGRDAGAS